MKKPLNSLYEKRAQFREQIRKQQKESMMQGMRDYIGISLKVEPLLTGLPQSLSDLVANMKLNPLHCPILAEKLTEACLNHQIKLFSEAASLKELSEQIYILSAMLQWQPQFTAELYEAYYENIERRGRELDAALLPYVSLNVLIRNGSGWLPMNKMREIVGSMHSSVFAKETLQILKRLLIEHSEKERWLDEGLLEKLSIHVGMPYYRTREQQLMIEVLVEATSREDQWASRAVKIGPLLHHLTYCISVTEDSMVRKCALLLTNLIIDLEGDPFWQPIGSSVADVLADRLWAEEGGQDQAQAFIAAVIHLDKHKIHCLWKMNHPWVQVMLGIVDRFGKCPSILELVVEFLASAVEDDEEGIVKRELQKNQCAPLQKHLLGRQFLEKYDILD